MATWTSASTTTTTESSNNGGTQPTNVRSATVGSSHPLAETIRKHYLTSREQPPQHVSAPKENTDDFSEENLTTRKRNQFAEATPPPFIKTTGGSAITKSTTTTEEGGEGGLLNDASSNPLLTKMTTPLLRQPKRFSTGSFPPIEMLAQLEETEFSTEISSSSATSTSTISASIVTTSEKGSSYYSPSASSSAKSLLKKKDIKKVKKLEKQEKEQKKKREEDMKKQAQEEEITDILLGQKRQLEDVQLALVRSDPMDEKLQRRASDLVKKLVAKGTLLLKSAKTVKNYPTQQKYKREFLEIEKEFTETTKRFLLDICTGNFTVTPTAGNASNIDLDTLSPSSSPESRSPPTSPPSSPRGNIPNSSSYGSLHPINNEHPHDAITTTVPTGTNPPPALRRTRSSTTNTLRAVANAPTIPTSSSLSSSASSSRFLSPPRNREGTPSIGSAPQSAASLLNNSPAVTKKSEKDFKKMSQKKAETMSRLGELHSLFTTLIDYFQPTGSLLPAQITTTTTTTTAPNNTTNTPPTTPPDAKTPPTLINNPQPPSPYTERGWTTTSPNTSGSNISGLTKNDSAISLEKDSSTSSLVADSSDELDMNKKDKSKRVSVGRTFGRMVGGGSSKKLLEPNSVGVTSIPMSPKTNKRESEQKPKQKGFFTPRNTEKELETLKMKKQQENFVMSLFLAQRPDKEALIARNIISQSSFGVSLERLLVGEQRVPTFYTNVTTYLCSTGFEGQLFDDDESLAPNIAALQAAYDGGKTNLFDSSPKVAAGLFKKWLSMLPDPLISPTTIRDDLLYLYEVEAPQETNNLFDFMKSLIFKLPTMHRWLLKDCISFLTSTFKSTMNSYTSPAISTIFGPIFFHTPSDSPAYSTSIAITDYMFANATQLFSESEDEEIDYVMKRGRLVVKTATMPKIIVKLIDPNHDHDVTMMNVVLNTYCYYTTSLELLENLISRFVARYKQTNPFSYKLRLRILSVLAAWMNLESKSLARGDGKEFVERFMSFCDEASSLATTPQERELLNVLRFFFIVIGSDSSPLQVPLDSVDIGSTNNNLLETVLNSQFTVENVAQQLTLMDKNLFERIPIQEFLKKNFTKPATSPCYTEMAKKFNHWSQWVSTEIVSRANLSARVETLAKFILIAKHCRDVNNFNTAYAIIAGLAQTSVSRLKLTWEKLPKAVQTMYDDLKELFNISSNHKNYRDAILLSSPPLVPYLGLYGKFLLAIEDGNPGKVKERINLPKYKKLFKQISEIKRFQSKSYPFHVDLELQRLLLSTPAFRSPLSEEETFKLSLVAEPRNAASSSSPSSPSPALSNAKGKPPPGKRK
eukprot:TRINITY_DN1478_c0_g1_i2.p1 TRINITY_DN1478_c0_g1~~TRINITY_DN1478_c0_g1_i2.p1  ORF type:complete len:1321 (+),score=315.07 TRINITY_DN1478_c0_g1_i2:401-4363(+)